MSELCYKVRKWDNTLTYKFESLINRFISVISIIQKKFNDLQRLKLMYCDKIGRKTIL